VDRGYSRWQAFCLQARQKYWGLGDPLRFHGQLASGIRISRIDYPGEFPGRYY
jgi:hypothetical protein